MIGSIMSQEKNEPINYSLPTSDKASLTERDKGLLELAMATEHGTPLFKIRHFVGDAQVTKYAKYKQLLLEIRAREEMIEQTLVAIERNSLLIEEAKELLDSETSSARIRKAKLDIASNTNDMAKTERRLAMMYSERSSYMTALKEMYDTGEAYLDDGTDLRDAMADPVLSELLESEHWTYRLGKQAALDLIAYGHIGAGNLEAISQMNESQAVKALQLAMTYSHSVKSALGTMEQSIVEAIERGQVPATLKIETQRLPDSLAERQLSKGSDG